MGMEKNGVPNEGLSVRLVKVEAMFHSRECVGEHKRTRI